MSSPQVGPSRGAACPMPDRNQDDRIRALLQKSSSVAVVGMSPNTGRPSHQVGLYLDRRGFTVIPVHPTAGQVVGLRAYPSVDAIPRDVQIDIVDVVVSRDHAGPIADQAAAIGAKVIWFQPGAENPEAERRAQELGLEVVSRRCIMADHDRLLG